jgi:hypothetical protein
LTHQADPYLRLLTALQTPGSPTLDFRRNVAPWLGARAGVFLTSLRSAGSLSAMLQQGLLGGSAATAGFPFATGHAEGAIVLDTSDAAKARSFLDGQASHAGAHATSYRGVTYETSPAGVAFGLIRRLAVIGSDAGLRAVIDTTSGGGSLAASAGYVKLLAAAPAGALAHLYSNPSATSGGGEGEGIAGVLGSLTGNRQANVSLVPSPAAVTLDADTLAGAGSTATGGLISADPEAAAALDALPGESWLAVGVGDAASSLTGDVQALGALGSLAGSPAGGGEASSGSLSVASLLQGLLTPLKALGANTAQARRDYAGWMGSAGIFASGGSLLELKAAVVVDSKDAARSKAAVAQLGAQLRSGGASLRPASIPGVEAAVGVAIKGLPVVLDVAAGRGSDGHSKFVLGLGEASVSTALNPPSTLSGAAPRGAAAATLGDGIQPSLMLDFPTLLSLLEGVGLTEDPSIAKVVPYLRAATTLAGGGQSLGGGVDRLRLVLGLHQGG